MRNLHANNDIYKIQHNSLALKHFLICHTHGTDTVSSMLISLSIEMVHSWLHARHSISKRMTLRLPRVSSQTWISWLNLVMFSKLSHYMAPTLPHKFLATHKSTRLTEWYHTLSPSCTWHDLLRRDVMNMYVENTHAASWKDSRHGLTCVNHAKAGISLAKDVLATPVTCSPGRIEQTSCWTAMAMPAKSAIRRFPWGFLPQRQRLQKTSK
jgi:hypothetical protein